MKIFAIYLRLKLSSKPEWFDDLRNKYSSNNILHITLVQPRYIEESEIQNVKDIVDRVLKECHLKDIDKEVSFIKTEIEEDEGKYIVMSFIEKNEKIIDLQKRLVANLEGFNKYCSEVTREYESNFKPHLTVADQIEYSQKDGVMENLRDSSNFDGLIEDMVIAVVNRQTVSESENPDNWIVLKV